LFSCGFNIIIYDKLILYLEVSLIFERAIDIINLLGAYY